jgi:hypothetical protein
MAPLGSVTTPEIEPVMAAHTATVPNRTAAATPVRDTTLRKRFKGLTSLEMNERFFAARPFEMTRQRFSFKENGKLSLGPGTTSKLYLKRKKRKGKLNDANRKLLLIRCSVKNLYGASSCVVPEVE